jgi:MoaA/NifB/PqqE/SkfB family radical SAM enzyme
MLRQPAALKSKREEPMNHQIPKEFDLPFAHGLTMAGWDFSTGDLEEALRGNRMLNPAFELASNVCPWNCEFCFTEDPTHTGLKRKLNDEMTLGERLALIDQAAALGTRAINFVGAGEPTIDRYFFALLERMKMYGITPIVYTEGALMLTDRNFVKKLYGLGATVVLKVNTLADEAYQNAIVAGPSGRKTPRLQNYFKDRNRALEILLEEGFADTMPTRLAFDTIICRENVDEVVDIHRYARNHNIFVLFVNYLPSGRSTDRMHNAISREEQFAIFERMAEIDRAEFGIDHRACFPYAGGVPCTIRGFGLFVKIKGQAFDCPGESIPFGNVREESLAAIWEKARSVQQNFNGGCLPRQLFWKKMGQPVSSAETLI